MTENLFEFFCTSMFVQVMDLLWQLLASIKIFASCVLEETSDTKKITGNISVSD